MLDIPKLRFVYIIISKRSRWIVLEQRAVKGLEDPVLSKAAALARAAMIPTRRKVRSFILD